MSGEAFGNTRLSEKSGTGNRREIEIKIHQKLYSLITVLYLNNYKRKEVITMPRTKGSKNRPKTNTTKDYAFQIAEKQETIASLNTEIASIQKAIEEQKNTLKE